MNNAPAQIDPESQQIKRPSLFSQLLPYLFTAGILFYVFAGLSSNVVDERHRLIGDEWSVLKKGGARQSSIEIKSASGDVIYQRDDSDRLPGWRYNRRLLFR